MKLDVINEYIFAKHNILPGAQVDNISEVANNHLGLHSARIMTPYTTLCSRLTEYTPEMLTSKLYEKKELIKLRCMRTTLHMVPHDIACILHMATLRLRIAECHLFFTRNNLSNEYIDDFRHIIKESVNTPKKSTEIETMLTHILSVNSDIKSVCAKKVLKYFWELGDLCYVNVANNWENEDRRYALTEKYYPNLKLDGLTAEEAQDLLVYSYIKRFGPATVKDFAWWSGLGAKPMVSYIAKNKNLLTLVHIDGYNMEFYILTEEYDKLSTYNCIDCDWVTLLAFEDPSIKGYYESRFRYVAGNYYNEFFNQIGEVRAGIMHNGKAIGVWTWDKKTKKICIKYFSKVENLIQRKVNDLKEKYEYILCPTQQYDLFGL
ncbi:MAG: crosslink repair DNA glycosylase YcaQ family protein [Pedobacter sp.]